MSTPPTLPLGFPTHSVDITGQRICLVDVVDYDFAGDDPFPFSVAFEDNGFRKKFVDWDELLTKPLPATGTAVIRLRLKVVSPALADHGL